MGELLWGGGRGETGPPWSPPYTVDESELGIVKYVGFPIGRGQSHLETTNMAQVATFGSLGDFVVFQKWLEETSPGKDLEYSSSPNSEKKFLNAKKYIKKAIKTDEKHRKTMKN